MQDFQQNENKNPEPAGETPRCDPHPDASPLAHYIDRPYSAYSSLIPEAPKPPVALADSIFAWLSLVVGYLAVRAMPIVSHTLGGVLVTWMLFLFCTLYLIRSRILPSRAAFAFAATACLLSLGWITGANHTVQRLLALFVFCSLLYYIYAVCGLGGTELFGSHSILHALYAIFCFPLTTLLHIFRALPIRSSRGAGRVIRAVGWGLLGLGVAIVPTAVIILLLSYDEQFMGLLRDLFSFSPKNIASTVGDLILGFAFAVLLFGVTFGAKWKRECLKGEEIKLGGVACHVLPKPLAAAAVTPILAVYVIFFVSQFDWYLSAFTGVLPADMTYASYARHGFFELCAVCAINAIVLLLFNLLIRRTEGERGILRAIYSVIFALFTLVLIATALSKMILYIDTYGLTQKRVYASWFMLLLAACFIAVLIAQFAKRIRLVALLLVICIVFFGILVLVDIDGMIADYNVDACLSGKLETVDVETLEGYGASSVPALCRLERELTSRSYLEDAERAILLRCDAALDRIAERLEGNSESFFDFNIPTARARALLAGRK